MQIKLTVFQIREALSNKNHNLSQKVPWERTSTKQPTLFSLESYHRSDINKTNTPAGTSTKRQPGSKCVNNK